MFESSCSSTNLSWPQRVALSLVGLALVILLVMAATVQPNVQGFGTHQQFGFPPCTIQVLYQLRCPACGMTTAWAHFVRGQWLAACESNVGGWVLALSASVAIPWLFGSAARGRWWWVRPSEWACVAFALTMLFVVTMEWIIRIAPALRR